MPASAAGRVQLTRSFNCWCGGRDSGLQSLRASAPDVGPVAVPRQMFELWRAGLAGRRAISWFGTIFGLTVILILTTVFNMPEGYLDLPERNFVQAVVSILLSGLVLAVGKLILRVLPTPYPMAVPLVIFAAVGVLHWLTLVVLPFSGLVAIAPPPLSLAANVIQAVFWLSVPAVALAGYDRQVEATRLLRAQRDYLSRTRAEVRLRSREIWQESSALVEHVVVAGLENFKRRLASLGSGGELSAAADAKALALELRDFSESTVRPISHRVVSSADALERRESVPSSLPDEPTPRTSLSLAALLRSATAVEPFQPTATILITAIITVPSALYLSHADRTFALLVVGLGLQWLILAGARRYLHPSMRRMMPMTRLLLVVVVYFAAAVVLAAVMLLARPDISPQLKTISFEWAIVASLISASVGVIAAVGYRWRGVKSELIATIEATQWESGRLTADVESQSRELASVLHGTVQGGVVAVAVKLRQAAVSSAPVMPTLESATRIAETELARIIAATNGVLEMRPTSGDEPGSLRSGLESIVESWRGGIDVSISLDEEQARRIDAVTSRSIAVLGVVREAITNACRHGNAEHVYITFETSSHELTIVIADDGAGSSVATRQGLGLQTIGEVGVWQLRPSELGGCQLTVTIPWALHAYTDAGASPLASSADRLGGAAL